jgi:O-antigen/teichoic acid export membrane protein
VPPRLTARELGPSSALRTLRGWRITDGRSLPLQTLVILAIRSAGLALALLTNIVLARLLGAEGFGLFSFVVSALFLLRLPATLGLDAILIRETAANRELGRAGQLKGLVAGAMGALFVLSVGVAALAFVLIRHLAPAGWTYAPVLDAALLALPAMALLAGATSILEAYRRPLPGQLADSLLRPLVFLLLVAAAPALLAGRLTAPMAAGLQALAYVAAAVPVVLGALALVAHDVRGARASFETRRWAGVAGSFFLIGAAHTVTEQSDVVMLALLADAESVGVYRAAVRYAQLVSFALLASMLPLRPMISAAFARADRAAQLRHVRAAATVAMLIGLPTALAFLLFGRSFMAVFGHEFERGATALGILLAGQVVNVAAGPVGVLLAMTGHERRVAAAVSLSALANVLLNLVLIPRFGIEGAAAANALSLALWNGAMLYWSLRRLKINPTVFGGQPADGPAAPRP